MVLLVDNTAGAAMVTKLEEIDKKIREMEQEIKFEVFCDRFKSAYVRYLFFIDNIKATAVDQVNKSLAFIKISYRCNRTNNIVTTTPETVYKKIAEYVAISPEDANKWSFCLPNMYYHTRLRRK